jgi:hypothetical protein
MKKLTRTYPVSTETHGDLVTIKSLVQIYTPEGRILKEHHVMTRRLRIPFSVVYWKFRARKNLMKVARRI